MIVALALSTPAAHACDHVDLSAPGVRIEVDDCDEVGALADDAPPTASIDGGDDDDLGSDDGPDRSSGGDSLQLQYGLQFLPEIPGHQLSARLVGEKDAWIGGELRYTPGSDLAGSGRLSAGFDVLGRSSWDLNVGLFVGTAGEWDRDLDRAVLYAAPIAGTEIGLGIEGERLYARYRWLGGWGGGPIDELLTENELTVGFKVTREVHLFGQYLVLSPGELDNESGVGLGVRVAL